MLKMNPVLVRIMMIGSIAGFITAAVSGCFKGNPYYVPSKPHHTPQGFQNPVPQTGPRPLWEVLKWQWEQRWEGLPRASAPGYATPTTAVDFSLLFTEGTDTQITWVGHATLLLRLNGVNILTDPQFSDRASPFGFIGPRRLVPPALALSQLPHIHAVVISHDHYDHLDVASVQGLASQPGGSPRFFVPLGLKPWFAELGLEEVVELDWWEGAEFMDLKFTLVPAQHFSKRRPSVQNTSLWGGWVVKSPAFNFYFAGDTGYSDDFKEIGSRLGPFDLAALPIGAYEPRWFMSTMHVNPAEAVQMHQDLRARQSVAMHWGTFQLTDEALDEPPIQLALAREKAGISPDIFFLMKIGETRLLAPGAPRR